MPLSQGIHQELLDHLFGTAYTAPTNIYVGLSSTTPTSTGTNVTEPSGGSYARVSTAAADWAAATAADPALVTNNNAVTFPTATADWVAGANLTHAVLYDAASAGNFLGYSQLATAKPVTNGDTAEFAAGAIDVEMGDADTDTFTGN